MSTRSSWWLVWLTVVVTSLISGVVSSVIRPIVRLASSSTPPSFRSGMANRSDQQHEGNGRDQARDVADRHVVITPSLPARPLIAPNGEDIGFGRVAARIGRG